MEEGRVVIINDLKRGNTRVIESINDIYECNALDKSTFNFQRPISIHPNFRMIFTLHSNALKKLSSAFFNRFIHIKIKDTNEITGFYKLEKGAPINTNIKDIKILTE